MGKLKEAGALTLKARQCLEASEPQREATKTLHSSISSQVQSFSSSIQAALVLPATQSTQKGTRKQEPSSLTNIFQTAHLTKKTCSRISVISALNLERLSSLLR